VSCLIIAKFSTLTLAIIAETASNDTNDRPLRKSPLPSYDSPIPYLAKMSSNQHNRTSSYIPPSSTPQTIPRKRNLSASAIPLRPPPNLRTSAPATPQPVKEEEDEDDEKDDYGDIGVNNGENRDEETKEERERLKYYPSQIWLT
jgi:hypothetical protein